MRGWDEFVGFVRGTRPRPPPGPARPVATAFLLTASLFHLPLVYLLVRASEMAPLIPIIVGFTSMGLAWASGVSLEGRRRGTTRLLATIGIAEAGLAFAPVVASTLGAARWIFVAIALFSALALATARRR